jgi:hypothetical protein
MYPVTSEVPRRLMVTLVVYFIVLVNVARGLREVGAVYLDLMRSYAASDVTILRKVRVPHAVPFLFTALKIAAPASVITAFVSEYFGGLQNGLGSRIVSNIALSNNAEAWAYVLGACLLGLAFFLVAAALEQWSANWLHMLNDRIDRAGDDPRRRFDALWDALEKWFADEGFRGSYVANVATELRAKPGHPAQAVIAAHRAALRQLLQDLVTATGAPLSPAAALQLQMLIDGAIAVAVVDRQPAAAAGARAMAGGLLAPPPVPAGRR